MTVSIETLLAFCSLASVATISEVFVRPPISHIYIPAGIRVTRLTCPQADRIL